MDILTPEIQNWLAEQVAAAAANGGVVQSGTVFLALQESFPKSGVTLGEVCAELVRLTAGVGEVAVEFDQEAGDAQRA